MIESANLQQLLLKHFDDHTRTHKLDGHRLTICRHLLSCHTPALGGMQYQCDHCHEQIPQYHSCRDRHCPQCQQKASRQWCEQQLQGVLPVTYHHVVFTLPHELNGWTQLHPEVIYHLLFQIAWLTLKTFAADPKRLNGKLGMTAVLHTWGQNLGQHVHLHCLVPGGALGNNNEWHAARSTYLFPVRALSRYYRGKMVSALRQCATDGKLHRVTREAEVDNILDQLMKKDWVVYSKHCLNHTQDVVGYLARYSHRIAISDQRIVGTENDQVYFRYKDYRDGNDKTMRLHCEEFIRRFLMHVVPKGLMRVRHYGLLANRCRKASLKTIRQVLAQPIEIMAEPTTDKPVEACCPKCHKGHLRPIRQLSPVWSVGLIASG